MAFFKDMIKEIIKEELADAIAEEAKAQETPPQPEDNGSNSVNDKNTTTSEDQSKQPPQTDTANGGDEFNVELLRNMIKKEVRDTAADIMNKQPAAKPEDGRTIDAVYASLLGIDIMKGDK